MMKRLDDVATTRFLRLARHFENLCETYREVRLHGPASDADAKRYLCVSAMMDNLPTGRNRVDE